MELLLTQPRTSFTFFAAMPHYDFVHSFHVWKSFHDFKDASHLQLHFVILVSPCELGLYASNILTGEQENERT